MSDDDNQVIAVPGDPVVFDWRKVDINQRVLVPLRLTIEEIERNLQQEIKQMRLRLEGYLLGRELGSEVGVTIPRIEVPDSTWQMFKQQHRFSWWLGWLVRRRPVRRRVLQRGREVRRIVYATYPDADIAPDSLGRPVIVDRFDTTLEPQ